MIKTDIVDYIVNNTTLSRSQAINATDSVIEAISHSLIKAKVCLSVVSLPSRRLLQPLKRLVISTKERLLLFRLNIPLNSC